MKVNIAFETAELYLNNWTVNTIIQSYNYVY